MNSKVTRRNMLKSTAGSVAAATLAGGAIAQAQESGGKAVQKGRLNQTVCQWCFSKWSIDEICTNAKNLGLKGVDLVTPAEFPMLKKYGLVSTMTRTHTITKGLNRKENWEECLGQIRTAIDASSEAGFPNVICFSGNRDGMSDEEGLKNCAEALKQIVGHAEKKNITINMELLNSKHNHKDYMCDRTDWGVKLCKAIGSDCFKLLYDIFHMQIMEGDVIATIRENKDYIGHYHTAGVPGRHEFDDSQELNYVGIMRAIAETGFKGYVGQEFTPTRDPLASLAEMVRICDV